MQTGTVPRFVASPDAAICALEDDRTSMNEVNRISAVFMLQKSKTSDGVSYAPLDGGESGGSRITCGFPAAFARIGGMQTYKFYCRYGCTMPNRNNSARPLRRDIGEIPG